MKMSKSIGQNTLIKSKGKPEQAIVQVKAKVSIKEPTSHGDDTPRENLLMDQKDKQSKLLKEAKPGYHMRAICLLNSQGPTQNMSSIKIHTTSRNRNLNKELFKCPNLRGSEIVTGNQVYKSLYFGIIYLSLPRCFDPGISQQEHENRAEVSKEGCKEESFKEIPSDNLLLLGESTPKMVRNEATKSVKDHRIKKICYEHVQDRGVIISHLFKEEPPDAQSIPKPKQHRGKTLESQKRMKADFLYLGAVYPVSRSKFCQGAEYDAVIKSAARPECHQTIQTGHYGDTSDIGSVQG
ncbi:hypothetical protein F2Q70_00025588 [Brassica cretica]|uniref:Uncharacterized protein n=1 Tax=Brassica cretica TaxID=69181 RepID=A0A8S9LDV6_BRACR|nr:hypothetical protein F2Q70_00025588 [Brassica cretica]